MILPPPFFFLWAMQVMRTHKSCILAVISSVSISLSTLYVKILTLLILRSWILGNQGLETKEVETQIGWNHFNTNLILTCNIDIKKSHKCLPFNFWRKNVSLFLPTFFSSLCKVLSCLCKIYFPCFTSGVHISFKQKHKHFKFWKQFTLCF